MLQADTSQVQSWIHSMVDDLVSLGWSDFAFVGIVRGGDILARLLSEAATTRAA